MVDAQPMNQMLSAANDRGSQAERARESILSSTGLCRSDTSVFRPVNSVRSDGPSTRAELRSVPRKDFLDLTLHASCPCPFENQERDARALEAPRNDRRLGVNLKRRMRIVKIDEEPDSVVVRVRHCSRPSAKMSCLMRMK